MNKMTEKPHSTFPENPGNSLRIIACTGDSHTWGQGGAGAKAQFAAWDAPVVGGEHRLLPWAGLGYVTLLRDMVNAATGSAAVEYRAETLSALWRQPLVGDVVAADGQRLCWTGALIRLQLRCSEKPDAWARIMLDDSTVWQGTLFCGAETFPAHPKNPYNLLTFRVPAGLHTLAIEGTEAFLYRVETYSGRWAVLNCGVGSCPVSRYLPEYAAGYLDVLRPAIVIAQGHTINDWLTEETPAAYAEALTAYLRHLSTLNAAPYLLTVEPILGNQLSRSGDTFAAYVEASREAARRLNVPLLDAAAAMTRQTALLDAPVLRTLWYEDNWHPAFRGHRLYAETVWNGIRAAVTE